METTIYLIRHAQAEGNWKRLFQGHTDAEVSDVGYQQLTSLSHRMQNIRFDAVYASPLARAVQTAQAVNQGVPIIIRPELMEINGGAFEGVPFCELPQRFPEAFGHWEEHPELCVPPEGEPMAEVYARMKSAVDGIARENAGKTLAVVSHGCAIRCYLCYASGWGIEKLRYMPWCDNTAVSKLVYDHQFLPKLIYLNDSGHLPEEQSTFATQNWWKKVPELPKEEPAKGEIV
ncbi:histidine phosphatase family protein [Marasmitruncus massiliensis]|uniref:histidine phosphatase family protein n=1 Tax=Marasmitruncus massiliensis TaxID=1944642 RepID=UPI000C7CFC94|nr:histidine phosphatase family protein [Marasmitruncus massiliensis]